jgi:hypothetical protein
MSYSDGIRLRLAPRPRWNGVRRKKVAIDPDFRADPRESFRSWVSSNCPRQATDEALPALPELAAPSHAGHYVPPPIEADDVEYPHAK